MSRLNLRCIIHDRTFCLTTGSGGGYYQLRQRVSGSRLGRSERRFNSNSKLSPGAFPRHDIHATDYTRRHCIGNPGRGLRGAGVSGVRGGFRDRAEVSLVGVGGGGSECRLRRWRFMECGRRRDRGGVRRRRRRMAEPHGVAALGRVGPFPVGARGGDPDESRR